MPDKSSMKDKLLETATMLQKQGVNLTETPALFRWNYDEKPEVLFEVMISIPVVEGKSTDKSLH